jgi:hypothetical protein
MNTTAAAAQFAANLADDLAHHTPSARYPFASITEVKHANREANQSWFDAGERKFFTSIIHGQVRVSGLFVESIAHLVSPRTFRVFQALPSGRVSRPLAQFSTLNDARDFATELGQLLKSSAAY